MSCAFITVCKYDCIIFPCIVMSLVLSVLS